ncbi:ABATE domain-containing protein [Sinomonas sp.]|uniref:CGNR zinc finger domain-containing protein n=1 Tax=Sinomonas sp. TaxID=1914986 RepID=UPI003FA69390
MEHAGEVDATVPLMELLATSPQILGHDGLNYVSEIHRIAEHAGLRVPSPPTLEQLVALSRAGHIDAGGPDAGGDLWCPLPGQSDVDPVRQLRERLRRAILDEGGREACERLTEAAEAYSLHPALGTGGSSSVRTSRQDVAARLASRLVPAAMGVVSRGLLSRVRFCADPWCRSPFVDRTRNRSAACCSPRCAGRLRKRRLRGGEVMVGVPVGGRSNGPASPL